MKYLLTYVERVLKQSVERVGADTPLFWSTWGPRAVGKTSAPMTGKNIWRLCRVYGQTIGYPELKPHDLRHGVAMEAYEERQDVPRIALRLAAALTGRRLWRLQIVHQPVCDYGHNACGV
jgi:integrase